MNNKMLVIILVIMVGVIAILGVKAMGGTSSSTATPSSGSSAISLSTNPNPLQTGKATFMIEVKDKNGKAVDNAKVSFGINMTTMNMGSQQGEATSQGNGKYAATGNMSMRGPWRVSTKVTMPDGSVEDKDFTVNVP